MVAAITVDVSALVDGQSADAADAKTPINQLKSAVEDTLNGVQAFFLQTFGTAESVTIAAGVVSPTQTHVKVDTEASAASDDLDTINSGSGASYQGRIMYLRTASTSRVVTLKHATGNIRMANGNDYRMDSADRFAFLVHNGSYWICTVVSELQYLNIGLDSTLTISGGAVVKSRSRHVLDNQGGASIDDLDSISGGTEGDVLYLASVASNRIQRVRSMVVGGNIRLADPLGYRYLDVQKGVLLIYDGSYWVEHNAAPAPPTIGGGNHWYERASAAAFESIGMATGTSGGAGALTASNDDNDIFVNQAIANVAATVGGRKTTTFNLTRRAYNPIFEAVFRTGSDITNTRIWAGLCSAAPGNVDALGAIYGFFFRYSTVAVDTGLMAICSDGAAQSTAVQIATIAASTRYLLRIRVDNNTGIAYFSVDNGPEIPISANVPTASQEMGAAVLAITTTATAKNIAISRYGCRWNHNN